MTPFDRLFQRMKQVVAPLQPRARRKAGPAGGGRPGALDLAEFKALWADGFDTREIALATGFREAEVANALARERDARRAEG